MRYVTIAELSDMIRLNLWKIPHDVDVIVGIPRSGMLPAAIIAAHLNTFLSDIDSFINGIVYECGKSIVYIKDQKIKKILVIDDSVDSGESINEARKKLKVVSDNYEFIYASPIVRSYSKDTVDIYFEIIDDRRVFEWNLMHHGYLEHACVDIDGVLCVNPKIDDDGEIYLDFLRKAPPLFTPKLTIDTIITCRLEKYRIPTEEWLNKNNIHYKNLIMLNLPDKATRIKWAKHGDYKGLYYKKSENNLFIESSPVEASIIAQISGKPVICTSTNKLIDNRQEMSPAQMVKTQTTRSVYKHFINLVNKINKIWE